MSKNISFEPIDFSKHPEMIQMDGKNLFALKFQSKHAKMYVAYASLKRSLDCCNWNICCINVYRNKTEDLFANHNITAHATSLIVNYGRCFVSGRVKLENIHVPKEYANTHKKLMNLRNDYIAHSGGSGEGTMNLIGLYPNSAKKKVMYISKPVFATVNYINEPFLLDVQNMVAHLITHVEEKLKIHYEKILHEVLSADLDDMYSKFEKYEMSEFEYDPDITPGQYQFNVEIKQNGVVYLKGTRQC
ncbi:MAG: hypothetical protein GY938_17140 [Ketobacter sp.]|nr:hypothetical protein [Ketobacter sp.]